jgi:hypothetical protein
MHQRLCACDGVCFSLDFSPYHRYYKLMLDRGETMTAEGKRGSLEDFVTGGGYPRDYSLKIARIALFYCKAVPCFL